MSEARILYYEDRDILAVFEASYEGRFTAGDGIDAGETDIQVLVAYDPERDEPIHEIPVGLEIMDFTLFGQWEKVSSLGVLWQLEGSREEPVSLAALLQDQQRRILRRASL